MKGSGCNNCPVKGCTAEYRGSRCAHLRELAGVDTDPKTNADRIRAMSDEELAAWVCSHMTPDCCELRCPARDICSLGDNGLVKWMKQPIEEE